MIKVKNRSKINIFYRKSSETANRDYSGKTDFLTSLAVFDHLIGKNLHIFPAQPNNLNKTNNKEATTKYLNLFKLEIFLDFSMIIALEMQVLTNISV